MKFSMAFLVALALSVVVNVHSTPLVSRAERAIDRIDKDLVQDIYDFFTLLPMDKIAKIAMDYINNDPEVKDLAEYLIDPSFGWIAIPAQQNDEFRRIVDYLDSAGLPASFYVNKINEYLKLPEVVPSPSKRSKRSGDGVSGMFRAIEALLPCEEIKALFEYKEETSEAFRYMVQRLEDPEFQEIVDELSLNKDFRILAIQVASYRINLDSVGDFLYWAFGIRVNHRLQRSVDQQ